MPSPYRTAAERLNAFVNLDRSLAQKLAELSRKQSRDAKLSDALETGRTYPMRQMHGELRKQRQLNKLLRHDDLLVESY
jgi:hypothetical protein